MVAPDTEVFIYIMLSNISTQTEKKERKNGNIKKSDNLNKTSQISSNWSYRQSDI